MQKPHLLSDEKGVRVENTMVLLKLYSKYTKKTFDNCVTGDETWVYYFEPKRKRSNIIWASKNAKCSV